MSAATVAHPTCNAELDAALDAASLARAATIIGCDADQVHARYSPPFSKHPGQWLVFACIASTPAGFGVTIADCLADLEAHAAVQRARGFIA